MDYLAEKKLIVADTRKDLLGNDLVLVVAADKPQHVTIGPGFDLAGAARPERTPRHRRSGACPGRHLCRAGAEASSDCGTRSQPRLARTEDVRAALLLVERGEAPAGIVYATDAAVSKAVMIAGVFPADSHDPVSYPFAVIKAGDTPEARALMTYLAGPQARAIFVKRGFKVE